MLLAVLARTTAPVCPDMPLVRTAEEREALQAAQSQELKSAIQAERAAYAQATAPEPTPLAGTEAQGVEGGKKMMARPLSLPRGRIRMLP